MLFIDRYWTRPLLDQRIAFHLPGVVLIYMYVLFTLPIPPLIWPKYLENASNHAQSISHGPIITRPNTIWYRIKHDNDKCSEADIALTKSTPGTPSTNMDKHHVWIITCPVKYGINNSFKPTIPLLHRNGPVILLPLLMDVITYPCFCFWVFERWWSCYEWTWQVRG